MNISELYPTQGIGGTNKYDLKGAISQVEEKFRNIQGLKVSFVNESNDTESWEYNGKGWTRDNFAEVGVRQFSELKVNISELKKYNSNLQNGNISLNDIEYLLEDFEFKGSRFDGGGKPIFGYNYNEALLGIQMNGVEVVTDDDLDLIVYAIDVDTKEKKQLTVLYKESIFSGEKNIIKIDYQFSERETVAIEGAIYWNSTGNYKGSFFDNKDYPGNTVYINPINIGPSTLNIKDLKAQTDQSVKDIEDLNELKAVQYGEMYKFNTQLIDGKFGGTTLYSGVSLWRNTSSVFQGIKFSEVSVKAGISDRNNNSDLILYAVNINTLAKKELGRIKHDDIIADDYNYFKVIYQLQDDETIGIYGEPYWGSTPTGFEKGAYIGNSLFENAAADIRVKKIVSIDPVNVFDLIDKVSIDDKSNYQNKLLRLGSIGFQGFPSEGYIHIVLNGQSLSTGDNSYVPTTGILTDAVLDTYMLGNTPNDVTGSLSQMRAAIASNPNGGECPVVNCVYALKTMLNHTAFCKAKIIGTAVGLGGQTIEQLSKGTGNYNNRFLKSLDSVKLAIGEESVCCPAIVWMQGEYNQSSTIQDYKEKILQLKNDMQADIMSKYSQIYKPLFFVYQTSRFYVSEYPTVAQALYEFANENSDVILMNPHYFCPTSDGGHLTANGYRWYGEYIAKSIFETVYHGNRFKAIQPKTVEINLDTITIKCFVPFLPMVVDTGLMTKQVNYGFALYHNDTDEIGIYDVTISPYGIIRIKTDVNLDELDNIYLEYGGKKTNGAGNIRDSDEYVAFSDFIQSDLIYKEGASSVLSFDPQRYVNLEKRYDENGELIYNKPYPMYNWLNNFRFRIK